MSELPRHGTTWSETEALLDVIDIYNSWSGEGEPDFTSVQRRLRDAFHNNELITLATVVETLAKFIDAELRRRAQEKEQSAQAQPEQR